MKKKDIFDLIDEKPIWEHLISNTNRQIELKLRGRHFGRLAEILGSEYLSKATRKKLGGTLIDDLFPNIDILNVNRLYKKEGRNGDRVYQVNYKKEDGYGKKVIIFEIKHGKINIEQRQLRKYCEAILNPSNFVRKANEVRVFYLIFEKIDTINGSAKFYLCELTKKFVKILRETEPKRLVESDG